MNYIVKCKAVKIQNRIVDIDSAYKYVVKGLNNGVSEVNIAKTISVEIDNQFIKLNSIL